MSTSSSNLPPSHLFKGELGAEIVVLSVSVVRAAQLLDAASDIETADGLVKGRVGDFVMMQANGERYPIRASVFYGTYQILGRVGSRFVGRRLLHARRAWPVKSIGAELDYGPGRGKVAAPLGGWVYRSDDDDYGFINAEAKKSAHIVVGNARSLERTNWKELFQRTVQIVSLLPPAMTLIALFAYKAAISQDESLSQLLLGVEGACLVFGAGLVWWVRTDRWVLKAAVAVGTEVAREFQCAVELLGQKGSELFPSMALWRAAQSTEESVATGYLSPELLRRVKDQVSATYERVRTEIEAHHREEKRAARLSWISVMLVLCCLVYAGGTHSQIAELVAIWLPSVVGALHSSVWRRQIVNRIGAGREFLSELEFVRTQLISLVPNDRLDPNGGAQFESLRATLRMLCRAAAEHSQRQLQFAISEDPNLPV